MPHPQRQAVTPALRKLLEQRESKGIAHYGESLHSLNGRDPARDLVEELVDAAQYALQLQMERKAIICEMVEIGEMVAVAPAAGRNLSALRKIRALLKALGAGNPPSEWEKEQQSPQ